MWIGSIFGHLSVAKKLAVGFGFVLILAMVASGVGLFGLQTSLGHVMKLELAASAKDNVDQARAARLQFDATSNLNLCRAKRKGVEGLGWGAGSCGAAHVVRRRSTVVVGHQASLGRVSNQA